MSITRGTSISAALLLAACCHLTPALADTLSCDDGIKTAFRPDAETSVIAVRLVKKGEELKAPDAQQPITAAADLCLVKLLVGPGATAEKDKNARSWSEGIGIEVWLPTHANWNERIRNYGGGGWVGGGHRDAEKIGSKVPAIVNANIGYASGAFSSSPFFTSRTATTDVSASGRKAVLMPSSQESGSANAGVR